MKELRTWTSDEVNPKFKEREHHHNLYRRIWLLPLTYRGRIIRKMLAYFYLQFFISSEKNQNLMPYADASDLWNNFISKNQEVLKAYENDYYLMMTLIRMIDIVVGNEPDIDFKIKMYEENIKPIADYITNVANRLKLTEEKGPWQVANFIGTVTNRWKTFHEIYAKNRQQRINKYHKKQEELKAAKEQNGNHET